MFLSIGSNCSPKENIKNFICNAETNFFDYTYEDFNCVVNIFQNINNPNIFLEPSNFLCIQNNIVHKSLKFLSIHDKPHNKTFEEYLPIFIETYTRRLNRLKNLLLTNDKIYFLHFISPESLKSYKLHPEASDIPNEEIINIFFNSVKNINENLNCILVFLIPPTISNYFEKIEKLKNINNLHIHYFTDDKSESDWVLKNYDWENMFNYVKTL